MWHSITRQDGRLRTDDRQPGRLLGGPIAARVVRADSLRSQVRRALEAALVAGELRAGETYSAPSLAEEFGVSATPVREAMLDLVKDGFVEVVRNKGFRVLEVSEADLDQISQIRLLLEVPTTVRAAAVLTAENFEHLADVASEITSSAVCGDIISYLDADRRFHLELIATAGNQRLTDMIDRLRLQTRLSGLHNLARTGRLVASADEHHQILAALNAGDTHAVTRLMNAHIAHTRGLWAGREEDS